MWLLVGAHILFLFALVGLASRRPPGVSPTTPLALSLPNIPPRARILLFGSFFFMPIMLLFHTLVSLPRHDGTWVVAIFILFGLFVQMGYVVRRYYDRTVPDSSAKKIS